jgi:hypothetical protein
VVHVGGTRCVTFNTDNNMNILARITLNVACMRACILICFFLCVNTMTSRINTNPFFFNLIDCQVHVEF